MKLRSTLIVLFLSFTSGVSDSAAETAPSPQPQNTQSQAAQSQGAAAETSKTIEVKGIITRPDGKPAEGAEVYLLKTLFKPYKVEVVASTRADQQGRFTFSNVTVLPEGQFRQKPLSVIGRLDGYGLDWAAVEGDATFTLLLKLSKLASHGGKVHDRVGKPIKGAAIWVTMVYRQRDQLESLGSSVGLPETLAREWATTTDAKGSFTLPHVGPSHQIGLRIVAHGYNEVVAYVGDAYRRDRPTAPLTLYRATTIQGQVQCSDPTLKLGSLKLNCQMPHEGDTYSNASPTIDDSGHFTLKNVIPGTVRIFVLPDPATELQVVGEVSAKVREGQHLENVVLKLGPKRGVLVSGQVLDADTGQAISGVVLYGSGGALKQDSELATTGSDGRYTFYSLPGEMQVRVVMHDTGKSEDKDNYVIPDFQSQKVVIGSEPVTGPDFRLKKGLVIAVNVVDEKGSPIKATVTKTGDEDYGFSRGIRTNEQGHVLFKAVNPNKPILLQARTTTAFSESVRIDPKTQTTPVTLVLREGTGAKITGHVINDLGQPVVKARVTVLTRQGRSTTFSPILITDARGRFTSAALEPQLSYGLQVEAPDHRRITVKDWAGQKGKVHDFGKIVLVRRIGFVEGLVVDRKGRPLREARIWQSGDTESIIETKSDAQGRFKLTGLEPGSCWIFAEKEGYQLNGQHQPTPARAVKLTLSRTGEPVPAMKTIAPQRVTSVAMQHPAMRRLMQRLITTGLKPSVKKDERARYNRTAFIGTLAQIDPLRASEISLREGGAYNDSISGVMANLALQRNAVEAAACFAQIKDLQMRTWMLAAAAKKTAKTDPAKARLLIPHALAAARSIAAVPYQVVTIAQVASVMNELKMPGGRQLLAEAVSKARNFALTDWEAFARGFVAEQVCDYDLETALSLVNPIKDKSEHQRHTGNIAYHIALQAPERAQKLLHSISESYQRDRHAARLCYRLSPTKHALAEQIANAIQRADMKAQAYVWIGQRLAPVNKRKAFGYIDRAVDIISKQDRTSSMGPRGASLMLVSIAEIARSLGHPAVRPMLLRALALRGSNEPAFIGEDFYLLESDTRLAVALVRVDAGLGRQFWETITPRTLRKPTRQDDYSAQEVTANCALAAMIIDPALCEHYLDKLQKLGLSSDPLRLIQYTIGDEAKRREIVNRRSFIPSPEEDE